MMRNICYTMFFPIHCFIPVNYLCESLNLVEAVMIDRCHHYDSLQLSLRSTPRAHGRSNCFYELHLIQLKK